MKVQLTWQLNMVWSESKSILWFFHWLQWVSLSSEKRWSWVKAGFSWNQPANRIMILTQCPYIALQQLKPKPILKLNSELKIKKKNKNKTQFMNWNNCFGEVNLIIVKSAWWWSQAEDEALSRPNWQWQCHGHHSKYC